MKSYVSNDYYHCLHLTAVFPCEPGSAGAPRVLHPFWKGIPGHWWNGIFYRPDILPFTQPLVSKY